MILSYKMFWDYVSYILQRLGRNGLVWGDFFFPMTTKVSDMVVIRNESALNFYARISMFFVKGRKTFLEFRIEILRGVFEIRKSYRRLFCRASDPLQERFPITFSYFIYFEENLKFKSKIFFLSTINFYFRKVNLSKNWS